MFSDVTENEKMPIQNFVFLFNMQEKFSLFWCVGKRDNIVDEDLI